ISPAETHLRTPSEVRDLVRKAPEGEIEKRGFRGALGIEFRRVVDAVADRVAGALCGPATGDAPMPARSVEPPAVAPGPERLAWPPQTDHLELRSPRGVRVRIWSGRDLTRVKFYADDALQGHAACLRVAADWWDRAAHRGHPGPVLVHVDSSPGSADPSAGWLEARIPRAWENLAAVLLVD